MICILNTLTVTFDELKKSYGHPIQFVKTMHRKQRTITCKLLFLQLIFLFLLPYQHHTIFTQTFTHAWGKRGFKSCYIVFLHAKKSLHLCYFITHLVLVLVDCNL